MDSHTQVAGMRQRKCGKDSRAEEEKEAAKKNEDSNEGKDRWLLMSRKV